MWHNSVRRSTPYSVGRSANSMLRRFHSIAVVVICLSDLALLLASAAQTIQKPPQASANPSASRGQESEKKHNGGVEQEQYSGPAVTIRDDQVNRLIRGLKSDTPRIGPFSVDLATILTASLWLFAIYITWRIASAQTKHNRIQMAISLHAQYFGVEHYLHVVAPVVEIRMKWMLLDERSRSRYREEVIEGWPPYERFTSDRGGFRRYLPDSAPDEDFSRVHFKDQKQRQSLTEHQALSAYLHFWSHLSVFISKRVADRDTCIELFADTYKYNLDFIRELRDAVVKNWSETKAIHGGSDEPRWVTNTQVLEQQLFGHGATVESKRAKSDGDSSASTRSVTPWRALLVSFLVLLFFLVMFCFVVLYAKDRVWSDPKHWGPFGEYVGGILGPLLAIFNIVVVMYIAYHLHHLEAAREEMSWHEQDAITLRTVTLAQWDLWNTQDMLHSRIAAARILRTNEKSLKELEQSLSEEEFEPVSRILHFFDNLELLKQQNLIDAKVAKGLFGRFFTFFNQYFQVLFDAARADPEDWKQLVARVQALAKWLADDPSTFHLPKPAVPNDLTRSDSAAATKSNVE